MTTFRGPRVAQTLSGRLAQPCGGEAARSEKSLQMSPFGGVRRRAWLSPTRPVTPEVAGSSPVAPAKIPANEYYFALSSLTPGRCRLHTLFSERRRNSQKRPEMRSRSDHFKPIEAELRLTARAGVNYTKRPFRARSRKVNRDVPNAKPRRVRIGRRLAALSAAIARSYPGGAIRPGRTSSSAHSPGAR
jgi:hypothetical protein